MIETTRLVIVVVIYIKETKIENMGFLMSVNSWAATSWVVPDKEKQKISPDRLL